MWAAALRVARRRASILAAAAPLNVAPALSAVHVTAAPARQLELLTTWSVQHTTHALHAKLGATHASSLLLHVRQLSTQPADEASKKAAAREPAHAARGAPLPTLPRALPDAVNAGWTYDEVVNAPNALSLSRALSGPLIGYWVLQACAPTTRHGLELTR